MKKIAVFPGSFDPFTKGHESVVIRAVHLFDEVIVAIGENSEKKSLFPLEKRLEWLKKTFAKCPGVKVVTYKGLTVDLCKKENAAYILRGLRSVADFESERSIAQMNKAVCNNIETVFFLTSPEFTHISSSTVREIYKNGGSVKQFVPAGVDLQ